MQRFRFVLWFFFALLCAAPVCAADLPARFEATWEATLPNDSPGYGVALLPAQNAAPPIPADWIEPSQPHVFAVGFDTLNPPTKNPFNADGNIDNRPQREISLHWNGVEVTNRFCPAELKGSSGHRVRLVVAWVTGGAEVSVAVGTVAVYDRFFVPDMTPYAVRFAHGGAATLRNLSSRASGVFAPLRAAPRRVSAFDHTLNDGAHHKTTREVVFPQSTQGVGRVICTLTLDRTPSGLDPWDRIANLYLYDENGERFEILRYMTPYRRAYQWKADVTDFLPLLAGKKKMELSCETYAAGWEVSVSFDFHYGPIEHVPYKIVNLWSAIVPIGQADKPIEKALPPRTLPAEAGAKQVKVRLCVTGHGQEPNTDNAAEFISLWRKLRVGDGVYESALWKTDNYLNPCRPQGGTWKYDRAGWGPGDVVTPWVIDVTKDVHAGETTFRYEIQPYINKTPVEGNPARQIVEAQIIYYR